jgi:hypothetical protein
MTSVTQLPVEPAPLKTPSHCAQQRGRNRKPGDEGDDAGFAAVLAQSLPEESLAMRIARDRALEGAQVEGTGSSAEAGATTEDAAAAVEALLKVAVDPELQGFEEAAVPRAEAAETNEPTKLALAPLAVEVADIDELTAVEARPSATAHSENPSTALAHLKEAESIALKTAAAIRIEEGPAAETQNGPREASLPKPKQEGQQPSKGDARRTAEAVVASKPELSQVDGALVIEFQVRGRPTKDIRQAPDGIATLRGKTAEAPAGAASVKPASLPADDHAPAQLRSGEYRDAPRPPTQTVAAGPEDGALSDDADDRGGGNESGRRNASQQLQAVSVGKASATTSGDSREEADVSNRVPSRPPIAAPPALQLANSPQTAAVSVESPGPSVSRPLVETRPAAGTGPASEPEVSAKLQQQGARTTLNVVLQDERLGRVALQLVERGGWIDTAIRASDPRTAHTLSNGAAGLFEALQQRGLTLAAGASPWDAQEGQRRENAHSDQEPRKRRLRVRRGAEFQGAWATAQV